MFESKVKEPALSPEMLDIVKRSTGEALASGTDEIIRYKSRVMRMLLDNQDLLSCLHCAKLEQNGLAQTGDAYRDVCIFDYMRLPDFKEDVKNYVCFDIVEAFGSTNVKRLVFRTVCHESEIETDYGVSRMDLMAAVIKHKFDWSIALGFTLRKESDTSEIVGEYYYREISYVATTTNNTWNKINGKTKF